MKIIFEEPDNGIHISSVKIIWNDDNLLPVMMTKSLLKTKSKEKITLKYIIRLSEIESGVIFRAADIKFLGNRPIINRNNMIINAVK